MKTSEWVSLGHPDKIADYISEYVYQRFYELDKDTRYAMEVQIKDNIVTLGGEITTSPDVNFELVRSWVKEAVRTIGYDREYQDKWGKDNAICADDLKVDMRLSYQSQDISIGVNNEGWGDQGIFWGMAYNNSKTGFMPPDIWLARKIGQMLYYSGKCGLDVKTQVTFSEDWKELLEVVVAAPIMQEKDKFDLIEQINMLCLEFFGQKAKKLIFNGTGRYVTHSSIGDCGTTGRKLVVDLYGANCEIGGGNMFGKDWTKADKTLNAYARHLALDALEHLYPDSDEVEAIKVKLSCCIGRKEVRCTYLYEFGTVLAEREFELTPRRAMEELGWQDTNFADICMNGMPYSVK